jgi:hypothetical protein
LAEKGPLEATDNNDKDPSPLRTTAGSGGTTGELKHRVTVTVDERAKRR